MRQCIIASILLLSYLESLSQTGWIPTGTDTTCANSYSFFQRIYGGNRDDYGFYLAPTPDSGYMIAGRTASFGNGRNDGLFMRVNRKGNVIWSKAIGGSQDDYFQTVVKTSDNGFIACGQTKSYGNAAGDGWLVKIDGSGNVQWAKKYGDGNVNGDIAFDVIELSEGGYVFCGTHRYAPGTAQGLVVRTDNQGNVIWSRQYGNSGSDQLWAITEDGNSIVVAGFYQAASFYDSYVMKLDKTSGNVQWIRGYDGENRSTQFYRIRKNGTGFQVAGIVMDSYNVINQQNFVWNLNADGTVQNVRKMTIPGVNNLNFGWYPRSDGGFITVNGEYTSSADLIISNVNADGSIAWSKKYLRAGQQFINILMPAPEGGGYAGIGYNNTTGTILDSNNVYMIRFDSLGNAGNCSGTNTSELTVSSPSTQTPTPDVVAAGSVTISNPVITVGATSFLTSWAIFCYDCRIPLPPLPPDTTCTNGYSYFQRTYGGNRDDIGFYLAPTADSGYMIAGRTSSFGSGGNDGLFIRVNKKGNVLWSKSVGGNLDDYFQTLIKTSDNGFMACGQTKSYGNVAGDGWLVKIDAAGNVQWSKKYGDGNANGDIIFDVIELSEGGYAFCGTHRYAPGSAQSFVGRVDNQGNTIWSRQYGNGGSDQLWGLTEDGNSIVVAGFYQASTFYDSYVMKLDKANGNVQWIRGYDAENRSTQFYRIKKNGSGYQVAGLVLDSYSIINQQNFVWNLNADGSVQNVRKMTIPGVHNIDFGWYPRSDGGFITVNGEYTSNADLIISNVNPDGSLAWSKKYQRVGQQFINIIIPSAEGGGYAAIGYNNTQGTVQDSNNVYLIRFDSLANAENCSGTITSELTVSSPSNQTPTPDVVAAGNVTINNSVINVGVTTFNVATEIFCFYCSPKPTGTSRPGNNNGTGGHTLRVYPNPIIGSQVNLLIEALYDDVATVSLLDLNGNIHFEYGAKPISQGNNLIQMTIPPRIQFYAYYFIKVQFKETLNTAKILYIN